MYARKLARLAIAVNGGLALCLLLLWCLLAWQDAFWRADFTAYYTGWTMILDGQVAGLYDRTLQEPVQRALVSERGEYRGLLPWVFPPIVAVPGVVMGLLPLWASYYVWTVAQLALLVILVWQLARVIGPLTPAEAVFYLAPLVGFPAVYMTFLMGQLSLLLAVCLAGFVLALREDRDLPLAGWMVLGMMKPQLMVVPAVILLARGRWRPLAWAAVLFGVWAAAATLVLGPGCWLAFVKAIGQTAGSTGDYLRQIMRMPNFKAVLLGLLGEQPLGAINLVTWLALAAVLATVAVLWWRRPTGQPNPAVRTALCLQLGLLFNPHFNGMDAVCYAVPLALFLTSPPDRGWLNVVVACGPVLFLIDNAGGEHWPAGMRPFFLLMVAVAGLMARRLALGQPASAIDPAATPIPVTGPQVE